MSTGSDLAVAMERLANAILESARADSACNVKLAQVINYTPPSPRVGADGVSVTPWPGSVDVQIVPWGTRLIENLAQKAATETLLQPAAGGGVLVAGPESPVLGVPVLFVGGMDLCITEPPLPGTYGLLFLTGKHHGLSISTGAPDIPRLSLSTERNSDAVFLAGFVVGALAAALTPSVQPMIGVAAQLGPRSPEGEVVHIRRQPGGWVIGGTNVQLGSVAAVKGVAGIGDTVVLGADMITWIGLVSTATGVPPPPTMGGTITTGSSTVKVV